MAGKFFDGRFLLATLLTLAASLCIRYYEKSVVEEEVAEEDDDTSLVDTGVINGHEYVDLGLPSGLKWAAMNIGADSPYEYGDYFAWGETTPKSEYTGNNSLTLEKGYGKLESEGIIGDNGILSPGYDAATVNWGDGWRMPTQGEFWELMRECRWQWKTINGKHGYVLTGPNGNRIFLPAAGCRFGTSSNHVGSYGYYWSSTVVYENYSSSADFLYFYYSSKGTGNYYCYSGRTVRPVSEE